MTSKAERAITSLRETADALDALPPTLRRTGLLGPMVNPENLRNEADWLDNLHQAMKEAMQ